jgi:hypothetical protein
MDLKAKLQEAKALISDDSRWTQGINAVDRDGRAVHASHPHACKWCARGALQKVFGIFQDFYSTPADVLASYCAVRETLDNCALAKTNGTKAMIGVNDDLGHSDTMEMFDCGITKYS